EAFVEREERVIQVAQLADEREVERLTADGAVRRVGGIWSMAIRAEERAGICKIGRIRRVRHGTPFSHEQTARSDAAEETIRRNESVERRCGRQACSSIPRPRPPVYILKRREMEASRLAMDVTM